jgi:aspartyl-tRNA(Asn)/glutamyl-tRNA(Gln) amidotransferase subunit B
VGPITTKSWILAEIIVASEAFRHIKLLTSGQEVKQETRGFDEDRAETYSLRSKEDAPDYRYMPDPNIPPLLLTEVNLVSLEVVHLMLR